MAPPTQHQSTPPTPGTTPGTAPAPRPPVVLDRNLGPDEWHQSLLGQTEATAVAARVRDGSPPAWLEPLLAATHPGVSCLELGSGTGELSAHLAKAGRTVHLLDFSPDSLESSKQVFAALGLQAEFAQGDVTARLPWPERAVDFVWSSGLLEHFEEAVIAHILRESARVARHSVIALVPHAKSLPYRLGKWQQERNGTWEWGREEPRATLGDLFAQAGLQDVREWSVAPQHALQFLTGPGLAETRRHLEAFYRSLSADELRDLDQGYLLVTVGRVAPRDDTAAPRTRRLCVVPNDPLAAYASKGLPDLTDYFNPAGCFDEVYCLSPHEQQQRRMYGMRVIPTTAEQLPGRIAELGIDVVRAYCLPAGRLACQHKVAGVPYLVSVHDPDPRRCPGPLPDADRFLAVSGRIENYLLQKGADPQRVVRLPNRVDPAVFQPVRDATRRATWLARFAGRYRILHVGRRSPEKNLETVIAALGRLGPDYTGIFVGPGDAAPYRALAAATGAVCHFVDAVPRAELADYYSFADAMCTPSLWEGFGLVFLEALACGALVITTDQAPMNELIRDGENGLLVRDHQDAAAIAAAIQRACADQTLGARLRAAAPAAAQPFAKETIDRREAAIYRAVLAARDAAARDTEAPVDRSLPVRALSAPSLPPGSLPARSLERVRPEPDARREQRRRAAQFQAQGDQEAARELLAALVHADPTDPRAVLDLARLEAGPEGHALLRPRMRLWTRTGRIPAEGFPLTPAPATVSHRPRVSVLLPTFDTGHLLPEAVQSVLGQTFGDFELIVVDDGSRDDTWRYLQRLGDNRVQVLRQPNQRLPAALNRGAALCRGELHTWISADNVCLPVMLERLVAAMDARPEAVLAVAGFARVDQRLGPLSVIADQDVTWRGFLPRNPGVAAFLYRAEAAARIGGYAEDLEGAEDWDHWLRLVELGPAVHVPEVLYLYREHARSMTSTIPLRITRASERAFARILERHGGSLPPIAALYPEIEGRGTAAEGIAFLHLGTTLLQSSFAPPRVAIGALQQALRCRPDDGRILVQLAVALARAGALPEAAAVAARFAEEPDSGLRALAAAIARLHAGDPAVTADRLPVLTIDLAGELGPRRPLHGPTEPAQA